MSSRSGNWDIYAINVEGGTVRTITQSPGNDGLPTWSPDGQNIAFVSDRDGTWGIYVTPAASGEVKRVADWTGSREDWMIEQIAWAP
jgi:Tol biopolymer transport system component